MFDVLVFSHYFTFAVLDSLPEIFASGVTPEMHISETAMQEPITSVLLIDRHRKVVPLRI